MKQVRILLDDDDYTTLVALKGEMTWKEFLLSK